MVFGFGRGRRQSTASEERGNSVVKIHGHTYQVGGYGGGAQPSHSATRPRVAGIEAQTAAGHAHSVVSSAVTARGMVASQLWPTWRDGRTHSMFRNSALSLFEDRAALIPLLMRAEQHVAYAGNAYFYRDTVRRRITLLNPEHVELVLSAPELPGVESGDSVSIEHTLGAELVGYVHQVPGQLPEFISGEFVAQWKPEPHPVSPWLGSAWVTAVVRELAADLQADESVNKFFEQGSTPRLVYLMPNSTPEQADKVRERLEDESGGVGNHWRPHFIGGGSDVRVIGSSLKDLALRDLRGMLHTLISARSRVPAVMLGISEAMQGASLMQGNYGQTRRQWADAFVTPYLDGLAATLGQLVRPGEWPAPKGGQPAYLSWDPARVQLMQEDEKDAAEILNAKMGGIRQAVDSGFEAESAVAAFTSGDLGQLEHSGAISVQVQQPAAQSGKTVAKNDDAKGQK